MGRQVTLPKSEARRLRVLGADSLFDVLELCLRSDKRASML